MDTQQNKKAIYQQSIEEVLAALETNPRDGLGETEAQARLARYGRNEILAEKPVPGWRKFLAQFQNVLIILLLVATAISAGLWFYERESALPYEAIAIFAVVLLNAAFGLCSGSSGRKSGSRVAPDVRRACASHSRREAIY